MADSNVTLASAVAVPEPTEPSKPDSPPSNPLKRRKSSSVESTKRPRLNSENAVATAVEPHINGTQQSPPAAPETEQPPDRRRRPGQEEERKRGKRLFGALLGTLSQSSGSGSQKRRVDIEKKQQAKLRIQREEEDEERKRGLDDLVEIRKEEQKGWDEEAMRQRHSYELHTARVLCTEAEPRLYYKPWDLMLEEKERIATQIAETQRKVDKELEDFPPHQREQSEAKTNGTTEAVKAKDPPPAPTVEDEPTDETKAEEVKPEVEDKVAATTEDVNGHAESPAHAGVDADADADTDKAERKQSPEREERDNPEDNEEMVVAEGEDAVIY